MNKTKIEWTDRTWNPVWGCKNNCWYCYAKRIGMRFVGNFEPRFYPERIKQPYAVNQPLKIFVCSMADLFGNWIPDKWIKRIIRVARENPQHTFQFLTKNPNRMNQFKFPDNCWVGTTITKQNELHRIGDLVKTNAKFHFVSFEPLLEEIEADLEGEDIDLIIIGALTGEKQKTKPEWDKIKHHNKFYKRNFRDIQTKEKE